MALATQAQLYGTPRYSRNIHYEVNLRPDKAAERELERMRLAAKAKAKERKAPVWDKLNVYILILLGGVLGIACVISNTWANEIQKEINLTISNTKELREDVEELAVKINRGLDISTIETRATEELGMVYPAPEQYVYLEGTPHIADFRQYIKENAYDPFGTGDLKPIRLLKSAGLEEQTAELVETADLTEL